MAHVQANISAFHAKLNEFRSSGKYCDLNIQVGGKLFQCHQLALAMASEYFDAMFNGRPREDDLKQPDRTFILLEEDVDALIFQDTILHFIYTGDVIINRHNVVDVLRASAIFRLQSVEERCLAFIRENSQISNILDLFITSDVALSVRKNSWVDVLSRYIMEHFDELDNNDLLMTLSFENFKTLLCHRWFLSPNNEDMFLGIIIKWLNHGCQVERLQYFEELIDQINFSNISADYMKCLLKKFYLKTSARENLSIPSEFNEVKFRPKLGLHMYILDEDETLRVYSTDKMSLNWRISSLKEVDANNNNYSIASIGLDDHVYSMEYLSEGANIFSARPHVLFSSDISPLKPPPIRMDSFDMCSIQRDIYVNSSCYPSEDFTIQNVENNTFTTEEISQGIFAYNTDVDRWLPLPLLNGKLDGSAMTAANNVLYLIEGNMHPTCATTQECDVNISALDYRTSKWLQLTKNGTSQSGYTMLGCVHEEKIYFCRGFGRCFVPSVVGIYNIKAQKLENFKKMNYNYTIHQLLSYENLLWAFGRSGHSDLCDVETFNACTQQWSPSPISEVSCRAEDGFKNLFFKNAFIFKSF